MGGDATVYRQRMILALKHEGGEPQCFSATYEILQWIKEEEDCPSLLGWDVLRKFDVFVSWHRKIIELRS